MGIESLAMQEFRDYNRYFKQWMHVMIAHNNSNSLIGVGLQVWGALVDADSP